MRAWRWQAHGANGWMLAAIVLAITLAASALAETTASDPTAVWLDFASQAPVAAALIWVYTLNARRDKERDDLRVKLEEMHIKAAESRDETIRGMQTELGKLSGVLDRLDRTMAACAHSGRNDRVA